MLQLAHFAKEKLRLGPGAEVTTEEGFEQRRRFLKGVVEATQAVQNASSRVNLAYADLVLSMESLREAFSRLDELSSALGSGSAPKSEAEQALFLEVTAGVPTLSSACSALQECLSEHRTQDLQLLLDVTQLEVFEPLVAIDEAHKEVELLRETRNKAVKAYDAARQELNAKEKEYTAKGRPIAESKLYPQLVQTQTETKAAYEAAAQAFSQRCDKLALDVQCIAAQTFQASLHCCAVAVESLLARLGRAWRACGGGLPV